MKQTRSTLKFLTKAYRSVIKHALMASIMATMAIAASAQAQAVGGGSKELTTSGDMTSAEVVDVTNSGSYTLTGDVTIKSGASLEFSGSGNVNNPDSVSGKFNFGSEDSQYTLTIQSGGKLIFSHNNYGQSGLNANVADLNLSSWSGSIINHGQIVIGDETVNKDPKVRTWAVIEYNDIKSGSYIYAVTDEEKKGLEAEEGESTRGDIVVNPNSVLFVTSYEQNNAYVDLSQINFTTATKTELESKELKDADVYFIYNDNEEDEDTYATLFASRLQVGGTNGEFDYKGLKVDGYQYVKLQFGSDNEFEIKNGFVSVGALNTEGLSGDKTVKLTGLSVLGLNGYYGEDGPHEHDLNGLNFTIDSQEYFTGQEKHSDKFPAARFYIDGDTWNNIGTIKVSEGELSVGNDSDQATNVIAEKLIVANDGKSSGSGKALASVESASLTVNQLEVSGSTSDNFEELVSDENTDFYALTSGLYLNDNATLHIKGTTGKDDIKTTDKGIYINGSTLKIDAAAFDSIDGLGTLNVQGTKSTLVIDAGKVITKAEQDKILTDLGIKNSTGITVDWTSGTEEGADIDLGETTEGRYNYAVLDDTSAGYTDNKMQGNAFYVKDSNQAVKHQIGAIHAQTGDTVSFEGTNAALVNATVNDGYYASAKVGGKTVAANLNIKDSATLQLKNGGKVGDVTIGSGAELSVNGGSSILGDITGSNGKLSLEAGDLTAKVVNVGNTEITGSATFDSLKTGTLTLESGSLDTKSLTISSEGNIGTKGQASAEIGNLALGSNTLNIYSASSGKMSQVSVKSVDGGSTVQGNINIGKNAVFGFGYDNLNGLQSDMSDRLGELADGSSVLYVKQGITLSGQVKVGTKDLENKQQKASLSTASITPRASSSASITTGKLGKIAVDAKAASSSGGAAISFARGKGTVTSEDTGSNVQVVLTGDVSGKQSYNIFDKETTTLVSDVTVASSNGVLTGELTNDALQKGEGVSLNVDEKALAQNFAGMSGKSLDFMKLAYDKYDGHSSVDGLNFASRVLSASDDGHEFESAIRMAAFAAVPLTSFEVGNETANAIASRFAGNTLASNTLGQANGFGIWFTPSYVNLDVDGMNSQGTKADADIDITSAAFGVDYTFANGAIVGAMFNLGTGSADSGKMGRGLDNDFDFYSLALYTGMSFGNFDIRGDVIYSELDNELESTSALDGYEKLKSNFDSSVLSVGLEGAYTFDLDVVKLQPHLGVRYSKIDVDDYTVKANGADLVKTSSDGMNVFSIPVGLKLSSEFKAGPFTLEPSFDLTVTANTGDTDYDYKSRLTGLENEVVSLVSETLDEVTFAAKAGLGATNGNLSLDLGVGYVGSENINSFGVKGNVTYKF